MAKVVRGVDSYKKEFLSIFNSLCGRHGRWEVWSDFIQLTAIDISNVTDKANAPKRAADARNIAKKYSEEEIKRMAEMLMQMVYAIDGNPDQDFLGELYMTCELGNDHAGQFFTPYSVCQAMSEISFDPARFEDIGFVSVNDCACGAGALLVSFANVCKRHDINYQQKVMFVAQDIDYTVGLMCYIYNDDHDLDTAVLMENAQVNPMKMLMVLLFALTEPVNHRVHDTEWLGGFYKCIKDDESVYRGIYSALDGIGYEISDMEKSLLDGTHPSYEGAEEES